MFKILKKLLLILLPVFIYIAVFIYFEPYNYFGIKKSAYTGDSAIVRVRQFTNNPTDAIILGDSRMAHFDMEAVNRYAKRQVGQLSFGGAAFNESMDLLEYAMSTNENLDTVYFGVSFYTLNESYYKDRMSQIKTIATNPVAYIFNKGYAIEMVNEIKYALMGKENVASEQEEIFGEKDYYYEDGTRRPFRKNLMEYADTIYGVCTKTAYKTDEEDVKRYIKLAKKCSERGIKLYTVLPPMDDSLKVLVVDKLGIDKNIKDFIAQVQDYTEVINYEYNDNNIFTEEQFYDGFHLNTKKGLPQFTQMLFER